MEKNLTLILPLSFLMACGGGADTTTTTATTSTSTLWWETTDTDLTETTTESTTTTKDTADGFKSAGWTILLTDGTEGTLDLAHDDGVTSCQASALISNVIATKDCVDCYFAMTMDIGKVSIGTDGGGCDSLKIEAWSEATVSFGAGAPDYGEFHGLYYTSLYFPDKTGKWAVSAIGYSATYEDNGTEYWYLGEK